MAKGHYLTILIFLITACIESADPALAQGVNESIPDLHGVWSITSIETTPITMTLHQNGIYLSGKASWPHGVAPDNPEVVFVKGTTSYGSQCFVQLALEGNISTLNLAGIFEKEFISGTLP